MGPLSHLFVADDVLLFFKASASQARVVANILTNFAHISGLKVNIAKSQAFYSASTKRTKVEKIIAISGIRSTTSLESYLGFPMIHGRKRIRYYQFIVERM